MRSTTAKPYSSCLTTLLFITFPSQAQAKQATIAIPIAFIFPSFPPSTTRSTFSSEERAPLKVLLFIFVQCAAPMRVAPFVAASLYFTSTLASPPPFTPFLSPNGVLNLRPLEQGGTLNPLGSVGSICSAFTINGIKKSTCDTSSFTQVGSTLNREDDHDNIVVTYKSAEFIVQVRLVLPLHSAAGRHIRAHLQYPVTLPLLPLRAVIMMGAGKEPEYNFPLNTLIHLLTHSIYLSLHTH
jgi:hypothetical protein